MTLTLTLKSLTKVKTFETYQIRKIAKICLKIMHKAQSIVGEVKGQGEGRANGQISLNQL